MITSFRLPDGTHSPLSNFYPSLIAYEGETYPTVEHAYQAAKTLDPSVRAVIAGIPLPGQAKRGGQRLELRRDWEAVKVRVMRDLLRLKFEPGSSLAYYLVATGEQLLIEGNTWGDQFWGQCPVGHGTNWLGFLLMGVRAELVAR